MAWIRNLLLIVGIAFGFPLTMVVGGVAANFASTGEALPADVIINCFGFVVIVGTIITGAAINLMIMNRFFPPRLEVEAPQEQTPDKTKPAVKIAPPKPFRIRLARFLGVAPSELTTDQSRAESKMPFWMAATVFARRGPKPLWLIRFLLDRIRRAVRGSKSAKRSAPN